MNFFKYTFAAICAATLMVGSLVAGEMKDSDMDAIKNYVATGAAYRNASLVTEVDNLLSIGGDLGIRWVHFSREKAPVVDSGGSYGNYSPKDVIGSGTNLPNDEFIIDANLYFDYEFDKAGVSTHLRFFNYGGLEKNCSSKLSSCSQCGSEGQEGGCSYGGGSGTSDKLELRRAYIWYRFIQEENRLLEVNVGRRLLRDLFTSEVQFANRIDGAMLKWNDLIEDIASYYVNLGAMLVNAQNDHYAYAGEIGAGSIANTGLYLKYSFIHWRKKGLADCDQYEEKYGPGKKGRERDARRYRYNISQFTAGYIIDSNTIGQISFPIEVFAAFLYNHSAKKMGDANEKYEMAWYAGLMLGALKKKGDWCLKGQYQYVGYQAVPHFDVTGRGYDVGMGLHSDTYDSCMMNRAGYKGFEFEGSYQITDNLSVKAAYRNVRAAREIVKSIKDQHDQVIGKAPYTDGDKRTDFEIGFLYTF